jgi:hypothetical protein
MSGKRRHLLFTSDTGLYPQMNNDKGKVEANADGAEIQMLYKEILGHKIEQVDLLVAHIGPIKQMEITGKYLPGHEGKVFSPNHLGVLGTTRVITSLKPKLAVVSEYGEELRSFRPKLIKLIKRVVNNYPSFKKNPQETPRILPSDLSFILNINDMSIYCVDKQGMIPYRDVVTRVNNDMFFYFGSSRDPSVYDTTKKVEAFYEARKQGKLPYFRTGAEGVD